MSGWEPYGWSSEGYTPFWVYVFLALALLGMIIIIALVAA